MHGRVAINVWGSNAFAKSLVYVIIEQRHTRASAEMNVQQHGVLFCKLSGCLCVDVVEKRVEDVE